MPPHLQEIKAVADTFGLRLQGQNLGGINYSYAAEDQYSKEKRFLKCYLNPKARHVGTPAERCFSEAHFCNILASAGLGPRCLASKLSASVFEYIEGRPLSTLQDLDTVVAAMGIAVGKMLSLAPSASADVLEQGGLPAPETLTSHVEERSCELLKSFDSQLSTDLVASLQVTKAYDSLTPTIFRQDNHEGNFILQDQDVLLVDFDQACLASPVYTLGAVYELDVVRHPGMLNALLEQYHQVDVPRDPSAYDHFAIAAMTIRFLWHVGYFRPTQQEPIRSRIPEVALGLKKRINRLRSLTS